MKFSKEIPYLNYVNSDDNLMTCKEALVSHLNFLCVQLVNDLVDHTLRKKRGPFA